MEDSLSFVEVAVLVRELKNKLIGSRIRRIYHPNKKELIIRFYKNDKINLRVLVPRYMSITEYKKENPTQPSHFCMFLRKYLTNAELIDVKQLKMERIIEFKFEKNNEKFLLIFELFSKGNIIICNENKEILIPLNVQFWKDRKIKPHEEYKLPPSRYDFDNIEPLTFKTNIINSSRNQIVKCLAVDIGLGGIYAEEICKLSNIDKKKHPEELTQNELAILIDNIISLLEKAQSGEINPNIVLEEDKPIDVQPFELEIYSEKLKKFFENYNKALDYFFVQYMSKKVVSEKEDKIDRELFKQEAILKQHTMYLEELEQKSEIYKKQGDYIYQHLGKLKDIFNNLKNAKQQGKSWEEIQSIIEKGKEEGNIEAKMIQRIVPDSGLIVIDFEEPIKLDITSDVTDNANFLYEKSKKLSSKIDGVKNAIKETQEKIEKIKQSRETTEKMEEQEFEKVEKRKKKWYERFHWFFTSENKLVIAGRDANQNEILIKKYLETNDIVLHGDVHGSPFAIIKEGRESTDKEKQEAAIFTLCHSKSWQNKRIENVYWVNPEQVSKDAPSGEYIGRGGFMIYGKKNYIKDIELRMGVGIQTEPLGVVSGPVDNLRKKVKHYAVLIPGDKSKDEISKRIKEFLIKVSSSKYKDVLSKVSIEEIKEHAIEGSIIFGETT